jgi:hypothetical protein
VGSRSRTHAALFITVDSALPANHGSARAPRRHLLRIASDCDALAAPAADPFDAAARAWQALRAAGEPMRGRELEPALARPAHGRHARASTLPPSPSGLRSLSVDDLNAPGSAAPAVAASTASRGLRCLHAIGEPTDGVIQGLAGCAVATAAHAAAAPGRRPRGH